MAAPVNTWRELPGEVPWVTPLPVQLLLFLQGWIKTIPPQKTNKHFFSYSLCLQPCLITELSVKLTKSDSKLFFVVFFGLQISWMTTLAILAQKRERCHVLLHFFFPEEIWELLLQAIKHKFKQHWSPRKAAFLQELLVPEMAICNSETSTKFPQSPPCFSAHSAGSEWEGWRSRCPRWHCPASRSLPALISTTQPDGRNPTLHPAPTDAFHWGPCSRLAHIQWTAEWAGSTAVHCPRNEAF